MDIHCTQNVHVHVPLLCNKLYVFIRNCLQWHKPPINIEVGVGSVGVVLLL